MRLILDLASALELCKNELSFSKDKLGAANKSLFGSKGESVPDKNETASKPHDDEDEKARNRIKKLRAEARKLSKELNGSTLHSNDKVSKETTKAKVPEGITCPYCMTDVRDQGKYREATEVDVHPSRFVKRTIDLHKGLALVGQQALGCRRLLELVKDQTSPLGLWQGLPSISSTCLYLFIGSEE